MSSQAEPFDPVPSEPGDYRAFDLRGEPRREPELCPRCRYELDEDFFCGLCGKLALARFEVSVAD